MKTFVYQGTTLSGPFELAAVIDMSYENSTITMEDLEAGSSYKIQFSVSLYEGIYILVFVFCQQLVINYFINPILGTTLITDGETSDEFYFYTLPTSPPSDLECATTYDSLSLTWGNPTIGMVDNTSYQFSYTLVDSMYNTVQIELFLLNHHFTCLE